uniref:Uncharacterized protein n=1 Tax=Ditylenchus dipsaci TaxID=166011 RepID=A0A915E8Q2_9BILA
MAKFKSKPISKPDNTVDHVKKEVKDQLLKPVKNLKEKMKSIVLTRLHVSIERFHFRYEKRIPANFAFGVTAQNVSFQTQIFERKPPGINYIMAQV